MMMMMMMMTRNISFFGKVVIGSADLGYTRKWVTLGNMGHTRKMGHTGTNGSHLETWVTLGKMGHTWKHGSHLEKWVTVKKCLNKLRKPNSHLSHSWRKSFTSKY